MASWLQLKLVRKCGELSGSAGPAACQVQVWSLPLHALIPSLSLKKNENPQAGVLEAAIWAYQGNL